MNFTAKDLALKTGADLQGDGTLEISGIKVAGSGTPGTIVPIFRKKYLSAQCETSEVAVLTSRELKLAAKEAGFSAILVHDTPHMALAELVDLFHPEAVRKPLVHPRAVVSDGASVHITVSIGPNASVESGAILGKGCVIGPGAVICGSAILGRFVRIGPNAVIGHEGFGFVPDGEGVRKIRQVGGVKIGDFVEIGAGSCVDRGTIGDTVIGEGSVLDNLVQVGHNAKIGKNVIIAAQTGLAGSTQVFDGAMIGGQVGVADHLVIGAKAMVGAKSGVTRDIAAGEQVSGYPAMGRWQWLRVIAKLKG